MNPGIRGLKSCEARKDLPFPEPAGGISVDLETQRSRGTNFFVGGAAGMVSRVVQRCHRGVTHRS